LRLAREVMAIGGLAGAAFNAAKEVALNAFIAHELIFPQMAVVVEEALARLSRDPGLTSAPESLVDVIEMDHLARVRAAEVIRDRQ